MNKGERQKIYKEKYLRQKMIMAMADTKIDKYIL